MLIRLLCGTVSRMLMKQRFFVWCGPWNLLCCNLPFKCKSFSWIKLQDSTWNLALTLCQSPTAVQRFMMDFSWKYGWITEMMSSWMLHTGQRFSLHSRSVLHAYQAVIPAPQDLCCYFTSTAVRILTANHVNVETCLFFYRPGNGSRLLNPSGKQASFSPAEEKSNRDIKNKQRSH